MPPVAQEIPKSDGINDSMFLRKIMRQDRARYERKGFGLIFAILIAVGYFIGFPILMRAIWPHVL